MHNYAYTSGNLIFMYHPRAGIGRAPEVTTKTQKLKATICLAENFPLDLQDQVMPIIDLMVHS